MGNALYEQAGQLKTNKAIIVTVSIIRVERPVPSEGKGGCTAQTTRSHTLGVERKGTSQGGTAALSSPRSVSSVCGRVTAMLLSRKGYWVSQVGRKHVYNKMYMAASLYTFLSSTAGI